MGGKAVQQVFETIQTRLEDDATDNAHIEDCVAGPAVSFALLENIVLWACFLIVRYIGRYMWAIDGATHMAVLGSSWQLIPGLAVFAVCLCASLFFECCAAVYVIPTQAIALGKHLARRDCSQVFPSPQPLTERSTRSQIGLMLPEDTSLRSFNRSMLALLAFSLVLHCDIFSSSLFVARVELTADHSHKLGSRWCMSLKESPIFRRLPILRNIGFLTYANFAWFIMLLQFVHALLYIIPVSPDQSLSRDASPTQVEEVGQQPAKYETAVSWQTGHGRCVQALAVCGRMCSITWHDASYLKQAAYDWEGALVLSEMRRNFYGFVLAALQSIIFPNLQVTYYGVQRMQDLLQGQPSSKSDCYTFATACLAVCTGCYYLRSSSKRMHHHWVFGQRVFKKKERAKREKSLKEYWEWRWMCRRAWFYIFRHYFLSVLFALLYEKPIACEGYDGSVCV